MSISSCCWVPTATQPPSTVPGTSNSPSQRAGQKQKQKSRIEQGPTGSVTVAGEKGPASAASSPEKLARTAEGTGRATPPTSEAPAERLYGSALGDKI